jgi:hypothetical protein
MTSATNINLASLTATQGFTLIGDGYDDNTGISVSSAGDVNNDGYDDVIIGAYGYSSFAGIVYVIYGGSSLASVNLASLTASQGFTLTGAGTDYDTGNSVSRAGDINNDGYDDMIIGAYGYSSDTGIVYVIYGGSSLTNINLASLTAAQGFTLTGAGSNYYTGISVSTAGDINNDGYDDMIIGAYGYSIYTGIVYVIYGGSSLANINLASLTASQGFTLTGAGSNYYTGLSVSTAGDINNDGYDDMIIGATGYSGSTGIVYVIYGRSSLTNINLASLTASQGFTLTGAGTGYATGYSVSTAGDINNDGYDDMIIGAPYYSTYTGKVYVIYGGSSLTNINLASLTASQGFTLTGAGSNYFTGYSVSTAGDVNKDGYDDMIIGAPIYSNQKGIVYVIYGGSSLASINLASLTEAQGFTLTGASSPDTTGNSVSTAGDINKDGYDDMIIGASYYSNNKGIVYVIYGANSGCVTSHPTGQPTSQPSSQPILQPTGQPSKQPVSFPTRQPSKQPTTPPTGKPTSQPSDQPLVLPTIHPSEQPTLYPTGRPSVLPTDQPSSQPILQPTVQPSKQPASFPTGRPSERPSDQPSGLPTGQPSEQPTLHPSGQPSGLPSGQPSEQPTKQPIDHPSTRPTSQPTSPTGQPSGQPSDQPSMQPTTRPTPHPTPYPSQSEEIINGAGSASQGGITSTPAFQYGTSAASFILTAIGTWLLRVKIAFYIIEQWGYSYRFIYHKFSQNSLSNNEIGLRLNDSNELVFIVKNQEYYMPVDENNIKGIPHDLHDIITKELKYPTEGQVFFLVSPEKNQLRNFLITQKYVSTTKTCYVLEGYTDLGYIKGTFYHLFLDQFREDHAKASEKQIRLDSKRSASVELSNEFAIKDASFTTHNPINSGKYIENSRESTYEGEIVSGFGDFGGDIELKAPNKKRSSNIVNAIYSIKFDNPEINRIYHSRLAKFDDKVIAAIDVKKPVKLIAESVSPEDSRKDFANAPSSSNPLMMPLLEVRNAIEYLPLVKYVADVAYPLVSSYLPELVTNFTLPSIIDNKPFLFTSHLVVGHLGAMLLPAESVTSGLVVSTAGSAAFGVRLVASHYLSEQRQDIANKDMDSFEVAIYCAATMLAYTAPSIATCAIANAIIPGSGCSITDLGTKISLAGAECYSIYKASTQAVETPTSADLVVPYIADGVALVLACTSGSSVMSVVSSVVTADYLSRIVMDLAPVEVKENYIDPAFNFIHDVSYNVYQEANDFVTCLNQEDSIMNCFMLSDATQQL